MFELPSQQDIEDFIIDQGVVLGKIKPIVVYSKSKNKTDKSSVA